MDQMSKKMLRKQKKSINFNGLGEYAIRFGAVSIIKLQFYKKGNSEI